MKATSVCDRRAQTQPLNLNTGEHPIPPISFSCEKCFGGFLRVKPIELMQQTPLSDELAGIPDESCALNVAGVYQDSVTRLWSMQFCRRATRVAGEESVQCAWYNANSLRDSGIPMDAAGAAVVADVIVVSVYAADELPLELCTWVESWLPRRLSRAGALTALIGVAEPLESQSIRTIKYLQGVARRARLEFIPQAHKRPVVSNASSIKLRRLTRLRSGKNHLSLQLPVC